MFGQDSSVGGYVYGNKMVVRIIGGDHHLKARLKLMWMRLGGIG